MTLNKQWCEGEFMSLPSHKTFGRMHNARIWGENPAIANCAIEKPQKSIDFNFADFSIIFLIRVRAYHRTSLNLILKPQTLQSQNS